MLEARKQFGAKQVRRRVVTSRRASSAPSFTAPARRQGHEGADGGARGGAEKAQRGVATSRCTRVLHPINTIYLKNLVLINFNVCMSYIYVYLCIYICIYPVILYGALAHKFRGRPGLLHLLRLNILFLIKINVYTFRKVYQSRGRRSRASRSTNDEVLRTSMNSAASYRFNIALPVLSGLKR
jgi:hypothetical protein